LTFQDWVAPDTKPIKASSPHVGLRLEASTPCPLPPPPPPPPPLSPFCAGFPLLPGTVRPDASAHGDGCRCARVLVIDPPPRSPATVHVSTHVCVCVCMCVCTCVCVCVCVYGRAPRKSGVMPRFAVALAAECLPRSEQVFVSVSKAEEGGHQEVNL
jgi:hypothetical protein